MLMTQSVYCIEYSTQHNAIYIFCKLQYLEVLGCDFESIVSVKILRSCDLGADGGVVEQNTGPLV